MTRSAPLTNHLGAQALLDERYRDVPAPLSESLDQCSERLRPFLRGELAEAMRKVVDECRVVAEQVAAYHPPSPTVHPDLRPISPEGGGAAEHRMGARSRCPRLSSRRARMCCALWC